MIAPRNTITAADRKAVYDFLEAGGPLSGYLAGNPHGGAAVQRLEEVWCTKFGRRHAIAVNSATSGLLAACEAVGMRHGPNEGTIVAVPAFSMSATAAVPKYCGAQLEFYDVDEHGCATAWGDQTHFDPDVAVLTTLFGHPIDRRWLGCSHPVILDNAQGILSGDDDGRWSEGMAHITVTSFNVHKQINAGEGGIISTDDDEVAAEMRAFINHGECGTNHNVHSRVGLNLRMTELSAVLALSQMARIDETVHRLNMLCIDLDHVMPSAFTPLGVRDGCNSARYCYAFAVPREKRSPVVNFLSANGVPAIPMYRPLYELPAFAQYRPPCPIAERMADELVVLEICSWRYEDDMSTVARVVQEAAKL